MATIETAAPGRAARPKNWARQARKLHLYLGTFFAPAILFFAITGALQTFSWHERTPGSTYQPPLWLQKLAQMHKKQTLTLPVRRPAPPNGAERPGAAASAPDTRVETRPVMPVGTLLQKWFVLLMSIGLVVTTGLGLYMAFLFNPRTPLIWILLLAGSVLPVAFALI